MIRIPARFSFWQRMVRLWLRMGVLELRRSEINERGKVIQDWHHQKQAIAEKLMRPWPTLLKAQNGFPSTDAPGD